MKRAIPWKMRMNQVEGFVSIGEPFSKHVWKAHDRLLMTYAGLLIRPSLTTSLLWRKIWLLALMEFHMLPTGVPGILVRNSSLMLTELFWKEVPFLIILLRVELTVFYHQDLWHRLQWKDHSITRRTSSFDFVQIAIASFSLLPSVEASIGTPWGAYILHRDASLPGRWRTTSLRLRPLLWPTSRALRKNQVSLLTDFAAAYPSVNHSWIFSVLENTGLPGFLCRCLRSIYSDSITHLEFAGAEWGTIPHGQRCETRLSREWFPFRNSLWPDLQVAPRDNYPKEPWQLGLLAACPMCLRWRSRCCIILFSGFNDCAGTSISFCGLHCSWISENCEEFREMQIVRHAKHVGTMIGSDGTPSSLVGTQEIHPARAENQCVYEEAGWEIVRLQDWCDLCAEFYWLRVRTRQGNPQGREPCSSTYKSRTIQRYTVYPSWSWLRMWSWSWPGGYSLHQPCGSLSSCCMLDHA